MNRVQHMKTWLKGLSALFAILALAACETVGVTQDAVPKADVVGSSHRAADVLIAQAGKTLTPGQAMIAASFVNIDDLEQSSSLGRIVSQQVASRFAEKGYPVVEMLLRHSVYIKQRGGEFLLSRQVRDISNEHDAQAVIVGTYAVGRRNVYVTARLIRSTDNRILASYDYALPRDPDVSYLLRSR